MMVVPLRGIPIKKIGLSTAGGPRLMGMRDPVRFIGDATGV
jgi:hypothetical protein